LEADPLVPEDLADRVPADLEPDGQVLVVQLPAAPTLGDLELGDLELEGLELEGSQFEDLALGDQERAVLELAGSAWAVPQPDGQPRARRSGRSGQLA
jgi:hypothetical protein